MPDTWTPVFNLSYKNKVAAINAAAETQIKTILAMVKKRRQGNYMAHRLPTIARIVYRPYYHHMRQTKNSLSKILVSAVASVFVNALFRQLN